MVVALLAIAFGFATVIYVQRGTAPPMIYAGAYAGAMFALYVGVRLLLPHSDAILLPIVALLTGLGLVMIYRLTYSMKGVDNLPTAQVLWILVGSGALLLRSWSPAIISALCTISISSRWWGSGWWGSG
ncbi:MAG: hypothetical protein JOZ19_17125 [Rubrobacter sp.]|nr:hypothetical protein [Rubrobacter sp.]